MSSPMVEIKRDIPLLIEMDYPVENEDTGFPFDDDREDQGAPFRTQLDDIAARHPEFAQHLGSFPFRSGARTRTQIPENFTQQRFADIPFGDFENFGFPFDDTNKEEEQVPYYQRYPKYYPTQNSQEESSEQSSSNQERQSTNSEVDKGEQQEPERGRRKQNIQQSNTVDLGQRQDPVDDRNQRSMSAPPPNNRPRFVSSINIPVNQPSEKANVAHETPQTSSTSQPQERVIPIHVEGRDEPVIPKKFASQNTNQPQAQPQPCSDHFFTQRSPNFSQYFNRDKQFQNEWLPRGFQAQSQPQSSCNPTQRGRSPQPQGRSEPTPQSTNIPKQAEQPPPQQTKPESKPEETPKPQVHVKLDPIDQIKSIQRDVSELMGQVSQFAGKPKDKQYLYLDEMLTRNLIKLDDIDTQGQENIRAARKEAIKCIEKCIGLLESKANANVGELSKGENAMEVVEKESEGKEMEVATGELNEENKMNVETGGESMEVEAENTENVVTEKMELVAPIEGSTNDKVSESVVLKDKEGSVENKAVLVEKPSEDNKGDLDTTKQEVPVDKKEKKMKKKAEKK